MKTWMWAGLLAVGCAGKPDTGQPPGSTDPTDTEDTEDTDPVDTEDTDDTDDTDTADPVGDGVFAEGCPPEGQAIARVIGVDAKLPGDAAVGTAGDLLIANAHAAFVITEPDKGSTYYHYGGIVADASPMDGCTPRDDKLDEVGIILAHLDLLDVSQSTVRALRGETIEVVADGSDGGPAIVRVTGVDDRYWLVEYELTRWAAEAGDLRPLSEPYGVELTVDYILEPDSPVLRTEVTVHNTGAEDPRVVLGQLLSFGPSLDLYAYAVTGLAIPGFSLDVDIPWLAATDGESSLAFAVEQGSLGSTGISGIQIAMDTTQLFVDPLELPKGGSDTRATFLSVGGTDAGSATAPLAAVNPEPLPDRPYTLGEASGVVTDASGDPVAGARIEVRAASDGLTWGALDEVVSGDDGAFTAPLPVFDAPWSFALVARYPGRDDSPETAVNPGDAGVSLVMSEAGAIAVDLTDEGGAASPARVELVRDADGARETFWAAGAQDLPVAPGAWRYTLTRGFEYAPVTGTVDVPEDGAVDLAATMVRVVDTLGWMSADSHVHSSQSPDSRVPPGDQLRHAAAHGLEVVIHTEHEHIVDQSGVPAASGTDAWLTNVNGEEVTASLPEHMTMFPVDPDGTPRGGIVEWYALDIEELFAAMRERSGGGISLINHPGYMDVIGWDPVMAEPTLADPTLLGLTEDAAIWAWDFDGLEVMNGHSSPFDNGRFANWQSFLNAGYPRVGVGASDDHGGDETGFPRTYFVAPTDDPTALELDDLTAAYRDGALIMSAGAFARVEVDDVGVGGLVDGTAGSVPLWVHIEAIPEADVTHAIVFSSCDEVAAIAATDPGGVVKLDEVVDIAVSGDTALVVAAFGTADLPDGMPSYNATRTPRVMTNAIYVDGDGDGAFTAPGGRVCSYTLAAP